MAREAAADVSVALVAVPETAPAVLYGFIEVFASVGTTWPALTGRPGGSTRILPTVVAEHAGPLSCGLGAPVVATAGFGDDVRYDVVLSGDLYLEPAPDPRGRWPAASDWIARQYAAGAVVGSVCTGAVLLAEAGLLDGIEATSHWSAVPVFGRHYPSVCLRPEKVLAAGGDGQRIITAGGSASWTELALYLIERYCGAEEAIRTAKLFVLGDRSEGQLPFAAMIRPADHADAVVARAQAWIAGHYDVPNPVARMVEHAGLPARTFKRRFRAATGYTPIEYVQTLRVEEAKHLLETTALATEAIAAAVGYEDPASFRRLFRRITGSTPARYRQRFRVARPA